MRSVVDRCEMREKGASKKKIALKTFERIYQNIKIALHNTHIMKREVLGIGRTRKPCAGCGEREQSRTQNQEQRKGARPLLKDGVEAGFSREHMY
jgi:hypothetical protein